MTPVAAGSVLAVFGPRWSQSWEGIGRNGAAGGSAGAVQGLAFGLPFVRVFSTVFMGFKFYRKCLKPGLHSHSGLGEAELWVGASAIKPDPGAAVRRGEEPSGRGAQQAGV